MLTNRQIFSNLVFPITYQKEVLKTGHDVMDLQWDHGVPVLILFILFSLILVGMAINAFYTAFVFSSSQTEELLGVEDLYNFYQSLYHKDL
jgi:hypothetical protein